jgi:hypothetical protein
MDLVDTYKTFHPIATEYTFFLPHKELSLEETIFYVTKQIYNSKKSESIFYIFSYPNGIKLEINNRNFRNYTNMWRLNNTALNKHESLRKSKEKLNFFVTNDMETTYQNIPI